MDYPSGKDLLKYQWAEIQNPQTKVPLFQDEEEGQHQDDTEEIKQFLETLRIAYVDGKSINIEEESNMVRTFSGIFSDIELNDGNKYEIEIELKKAGEFPVKYPNPPGEQVSVAGGKDYSGWRAYVIDKTYPADDIYRIAYSPNGHNGVPVIDIRVEIESSTTIQDFMDYLYSSSAQQIEEDKQKTLALLVKAVDVDCDDAKDILEISPIDYYKDIDLETRVKAINCLLDENWVHETDEKIVIQLIEQAPNPEKLMEKMMDGSIHFEALYSKLDSKSEDLVNALLKVWAKSLRLFAGNEGLALKWGLSTRFNEIDYFNVDMNDSIRIFHVIKTYQMSSNYVNFVGGNAGMSVREKDAIYAGAFTPIMVDVQSSTGAMRDFDIGKIGLVPLFYIGHLVKVEEEMSRDAARNFMIAAMTGGTSLTGLMSTTSGIIKIYRFAELTLPLLGAVVNAPPVRAEISQLEYGEEFIATINTLDIFIGVMSVGEIVQVMPTLGKMVVNAWAKVKANNPQVANNPTKYKSVNDGVENIAKEYNIAVVPNNINKGVSKLPDNIAATFMGRKYTEIVLEVDMVLYRAGHKDVPLGQFFSKEKPISVIQTRIDKAVVPVWPDGAESILDYGYKVKIPKGTKVYIGDVAPQGGYYLGGTEQIVVLNPWEIKGIEILDRFELVK